MITLYLNGKRAVIDEGQAFKLVRDNTYFTKSGTYTYNISLPVCPENIAIFGMLSRKDVSKSDTKYEARMLVNNSEVLNGAATVTNVSEEEIKIQLIGGNAELNFFAKNENRYIDELPLGTWNRANSTDLTMRETAEMIQAEFEYTMVGWGVDEAYKLLCKRLWAENTKANPVDWVALPCVNSNFNVTCNNFGIKTFTDSSGNVARIPAINDLDNVNLSAQPYLVPMIERVFKNIGYPVVENCLKDNEFFMHLVIVTANNRSAIARALPHWTVAQFIEEIENLFAVVIFIDDVTKKTYIKSRADYFNEKVEYINNVLEEYSVTIDSNNTTDIANANIGYAEVTDMYDRIDDDDIRDAAKIDTTYNNEEDFAYALQNLVDKLKKDRGSALTSDGLLKHKGTIFKVCGRSFIIQLYDTVDSQGRLYTNHAKTICVDEFANLIQVEGKKDLDIELKICPAKSINDGSVTFYNADGSISKTKSCFHLVKADNTDSAGIENETNIYIAGLISGETKKADTKEDIMSICLYDGGIAKRAENDSNAGYPMGLLTMVDSVYYPAGHIKDQWQGDTYTAGGTLQKSAYESLSLYIDSVYRTIYPNKYTYRSFYSEVFKKLKKIDTQVKYCFKFITDRIDLPVNSTFVIRNKKFVCEKLEYNIKADGVSKLVTGYFYELEE